MGLIDIGGRVMRENPKQRLQNRVIGCRVKKEGGQGRSLEELWVVVFRIPPPVPVPAVKIGLLGGAGGKQA